MDVVYYGLILLLPMSALMARRLPIGQTLRMAIAWIAIFGVAFLVVGQRERLASVWPHEAAPDGVVRIPASKDGHFYADVRINGVERRMLIDSGATTTALSEATAKAARLDLNESPFGSLIETANGRVTAAHTSIAELTIGTIHLTNVGADVSPSFGDQDIIGMNILRRFKAWRVEGGMLILNDVAR